ncbi:hypothetical protein GCM10023219_21510 [Stakelama sediminis]|uniref:Carboxylic ester hydrolase n=1 Tax=Stakelama sediminis TaxID=463200 RepID=A0A840YZZ2_9SPHN|nr:carboxylesterase family protein [Stakelama sediminis]MBB5719107.1 para-nitrobenzyl esterase [Stakelama sediminis]
MKRYAFSLVAMLTIAAPITAYAQQSGPVVQDANGQLRGSVENGVASWKGIPFAAPPVGNLRWAPPEPAANWKGVRDATRYSHDCMQKPFASDAAPLGTTPSEDCLYANVWKPAGAKGKLPVLVWIYGGGYVNGGASPPTYSGANMARKGVMFVSFNYRLGRFGTFALPQLDAKGGKIINYGTMDQVAALQWVKRNIGAFGGDASNVTIMGESAGGMSVHNLVTSPQAKGLFQKAVVMSGGTGLAQPGQTVAAAEQAGANFARAMGIDPDAPDALAKLRALSGEQVIDDLNLATMPGSGPEPKTYVGPVVDGTVIVDQGKAYRSGAFTHVPMIIGATSDDIGGRTGYMVVGARGASVRIAAQGVPVWEYRFSYVAQSLHHEGATHASDIPFFFDTQAIKYGADTTARDNAMGKTISAYIVRFVKAGDPNGSGLANWPRFHADSDVLMNFQADGKAAAEKDPWGADKPDTKTDGE